jgi:uncharacterized membrane protein
MRKAVAWNLVIGIVAAAVVAGYAVYKDVTWNVPLFLMLFLLAVLPAAREVGRGRAFGAGARLRKHHDEAKERET